MLHTKQEEFIIGLFKGVLKMDRKVGIELSPRKLAAVAASTVLFLTGCQIDNSEQPRQKPAAARIDRKPPRAIDSSSPTASPQILVPDETAAAKPEESSEAPSPYYKGFKQKESAKTCLDLWYEEQQALNDNGQDTSGPEQMPFEQPTTQLEACKPDIVQGPACSIIDIDKYYLDQKAKGKEDWPECQVFQEPTLE